MIRGTKVLVCKGYVRIAAFDQKAGSRGYYAGTLGQAHRMATGGLNPDAQATHRLSQHRCFLIQLPPPLPKVLCPLLLCLARHALCGVEV